MPWRLKKAVTNETKKNNLCKAHITEVLTSKSVSEHVLLNLFVFFSSYVAEKTKLSATEIMRARPRVHKDTEESEMNITGHPHSRVARGARGARV